MHESVQLAEGCRAERLQGWLFHLTYRSIHEFLERMNRYTDLAAATADMQGKRFSTLRLLTRPPATFLKYYLLRRGILDGMRGLVASAGAAMYVFLKLAKQWELHRESDPTFLQAAGATPEDPDPGALPRSAA